MLPSSAPRAKKGNEGLMPVNQPVKLTMLVLLASFFLSYGVGSIRCATVPGNSTDVTSLLDFKAITNDPTGALSSWNTSIHCCEWSGITCNPKNRGRVTALNLTGKGLSGQIASSLGNLTDLHTLDLSGNNFSGQIPPLNHQKLKYLHLGKNSLNGTIPDSLTNCSNLFWLDLSNNMLVGTVPPTIGLLHNLSVLALNSNNLTGSVPSTLGNLTNLGILFLATNKLEGNIPHQLGQLSKLWWFSLSENNISGGFPPGFFRNLSSLNKLSIETTLLGGTLPSDFGDTLPNLTQLYLSDNMFEGHIPASLGNSSSLEVIDLSSNRFIGQIPSSFGRLSGLSTLNLEKNNLEASDNKGWEFLFALRNCRNLQVLSLSKNQLFGVIPNSIGGLPISLTNLLLGGNKLTGIVPTSIANLHGLISLGLDYNGFTGTFEWIGKLKNLQVLNFGYNNFSGPIPSSISELSGLTKLFLQSNKFEGSIPPILGKLSQLTKLNLSNNNLQSRIPLSIGTLGKLVELSLSSNKLVGEIPDTLSQCQYLTSIEMDQNLLVGSIPISLDKILGLVKLNLSHNNLSGTIPATLSNLQLLRSLDISYNHLSGDIPRNGVFSNATAVSLGSNWGLCGGAMEFNMPQCPTASRGTERQYLLVKVLIPIFGFMSLLLLAYFLLMEKKRPRGKYASSMSFGESFLKVSYNDLAQATKDFSEDNLVGKGGCGSVYRGKLKEQKMEVAVKVFNLEMRGAERSFLSECEALRSIQHRNLLPIITACSTVDITGNVFKALVYEFMPNGNLDTWLHHKVDGKASKYLGLNQRISIAVNIADALDYLHHDCGRPTVHCDLKPSNVLLDDDMTALLGDFGIARFYVDYSPMSTDSVSSIGVKGTIGYIAPEYGRGGHVSTSGDVYSYGIMLMEMITGKRPADPMFKDGMSIVNFVESYFPDQLSHVISCDLLEECKSLSQAREMSENPVYRCLVCLLELSLSCTRPMPSERMNMKQIAGKVHAINESYLGWKTKKNTST